MASTTFVDNSTVVIASWLNDVNSVVYNLLGNGTIIPASKPALLASINAPSIDVTVQRTTATGAAIIPAGTTAQRDVTPLQGFLRYNATINSFEGYSGTAWGSVGGGATGAGNDTVFQENSRVVTTSYTLTAGKNASAIGPLTFNSGVRLTVPTGARFITF